jgi:hypothetical protein
MRIELPWRFAGRPAAARDHPRTGNARRAAGKPDHLPSQRRRIKRRDHAAKHYNLGLDFRGHDRA